MFKNPFFKHQFSEIEYFENSILADRLVVSNNLKELRKRVDRTRYLILHLIKYVFQREFYKCRFMMLKIQSYIFFYLH
jgi:hypothetical protein